MPNGFKTHDMFVPYRRFGDVAAEFGIRRELPLRGNSMPELWEKDDVEAVKAHNLDDIRGERKLSEVLRAAGLVKPVAARQGVKDYGSGSPN